LVYKKDESEISSDTHNKLLDFLGLEDCD